MSDSARPPPVLVQALLCDDVRRENNSKQFIIGIYASQIVVPSFPVTIQICLWMRMLLPVNGINQIEISAIDERETRLLLPQTLNVDVPDHTQLFDLAIGGIAMELQASGKVLFQWRTPGEVKWKNAVDIMVVQGTITQPTATIPSASIA